MAIKLYAYKENSMRYITSKVTFAAITLFMLLTVFPALASAIPDCEPNLQYEPVPEWTSPPAAKVYGYVTF